jgi:hypothetical protein
MGGGERRGRPRGPARSAGAATWRLRTGPRRCLERAYGDRAKWALGHNVSCIDHASGGALMNKRLATYNQLHRA